MDAKLDAEKAPEELNTIKIAANENVENGIVIASAESDANISSDEKKWQATYKRDIDSTKLLLGVELPILEENIQLPSNRSKIQKVPALLLRNSNFERYCSPKMISFGPIHHRGHTHDLRLGQQFKYIWAFRYIEKFASERRGLDNEGAKRFLYGKVTQNLQELRNLFCKDVTKGYKEEELAKMLFVDGCALLYFMDNFDDRNPKSLLLKLDQLLYVWRDIILLENQLPIMLLKLLMADGAHQLNKLLFNFLSMGQPKKKKELTIPQKQDGEESTHTHLLDYIRYYYSEGEYKHNIGCWSGLLGFLSILHYTFVALVLQDTDKAERVLSDSPIILRELILPLREADSWHRYKNIGDLKKAGIRVKASQAEWKWGNISFISNTFSGQLMLPGIVIDDVTPYLYHNLIAYEMCPDFDNNFEFCSYFSLMDSLVDDAEDVKELRAAGVLQNLLGSDEDVAKLFNELGHVLPSKLFNAESYDNRYVAVKLRIDAHYRNKWKTSLAQLRSTYFNTPWSHIAFFAALLVLALTLIQTWYAMPINSK
ncbi:putative UPF0481 protein At3g02645 isoform X1 [Arachis duranensis]|uniref:UPF0481 protein At3g02645 isoform X1 n=2 Tax=Arachis duranensis TaxID=130453 RepID=A0A6P4CBL7_ARADU|nr:putative UPF0481 protein At3g02645 isoform X1 [Arachis duranensis]